MTEPSKHAIDMAELTAEKCMKLLLKSVTDMRHTPDETAQFFVGLLLAYRQQAIDAATAEMREEIERLHCIIGRAHDSIIADEDAIQAVEKLLQQSTLREPKMVDGDWARRLRHKQREHWMEKCGQLCEEIERLKKNHLQDALDHVCLNIPEGIYCIQIEVGKDWGGVEWVDEDGGSHEVEAYDKESMAEQVMIALAQAAEYVEENQNEKD